MLCDSEVPMDFMPISGREYPRFSSIKTFFRLPHAQLNEPFDVAILGIPFDGGVSYRPGARFAPASLRDISSLGRSFHWNHDLNIFKSIKCADIGDCKVVPISLEKSYHLIESQVTQVLSNKKRLVSIGGDHSITLPILRGFKKAFQTPLNLIHFDAHLDTYPAAWDCEYHHGSFLRHAIEENLVDPKNTIQIGIRGPFAGSDDLDFVASKGVQVISNEMVKLKGVVTIANQLRKLKGPTYISFDIDCLDPAYAPGTGTPVPGGLTTFEAQYLLRQCAGTQIVGGDVVEVSPPFDHAQITALAAMDVAFEILSLIAKNSEVSSSS